MNPVELQRKCATVIVTRIGEDGQERETLVRVEWLSAGYDLSFEDWNLAGQLAAEDVQQSGGLGLDYEVRRRAPFGWGSLPEWSTRVVSIGLCL